MNRIIIISFSILFGMLSGIHPLYGQSDSTKKQLPSERKATDSEKNQILSRQTDELQSAKNDQTEDSIRLLQLKYELLKLGDNDNAKKLSISAEQDQIKIKDSLRKV